MAVLVIKFVKIVKIEKNSAKCNVYIHCVVLFRIPTNDADCLHIVSRMTGVHCLLILYDFLMRIEVLCQSYYDWFNINYPPTPIPIPNRRGGCFALISALLSSGTCHRSSRLDEIFQPTIEYLKQIANASPSFTKNMFGDKPCVLKRKSKISQPYVNWKTFGLKSFRYEEAGICNKLP